MINIKSLFIIKDINNLNFFKRLRLLVAHNNKCVSLIAKLETEEARRANQRLVVRVRRGQPDLAVAQLLWNHVVANCHKAEKLLDFFLLKLT